VHAQLDAHPTTERNGPATHTTIVVANGAIC
jgi:hypothetical protein